MNSYERMVAAASSAFAAGACMGAVVAARDGAPMRAEDLPVFLGAVFDQAMAQEPELAVALKRERVVAYGVLRG